MDNRLNVTVKFKLNDSQTIAQVYSNDKTVEHIRKDISKKIQIHEKYLSLYKDNELISNTNVLLADVCLNTSGCGIVEFEIKLNDLAKEFNENTSNKNHQICLTADLYYNNFVLPDFLPVYILPENREVCAKRIIVQITNQPIVKPFLGGYINNLTKCEYHDAFTQTGPSFEKMRRDDLETRDCQTSEKLDKDDDTHYDRSSQAFGIATELIYIPSQTDYFIEPKKYETYDERCRRINLVGKVKLIQRNFRRYLWQKLIKKSAAEWRQLVEEQKRREIQREDRFINTFKQECTIKSFPRTREDFNVLYAQVQVWKDNEIKRIGKLYSGGPKIAELNCLLDKEVQLLNGIERQRSKIRSQLAEIRAEKTLSQMGQPIKWIGYRNIVCEMDTLRTQKIRYLTELFKEMKTPMTECMRLKFIDHFIHVIHVDKPNKNVEELLHLFNREKQSIACNLNESVLEPLRQRQQMTFYDFIKEHKGKFDEKQNQETKMCKKCKSVRPVNQFTLQTRQDEVNICKNCTYLKVPPVDITIYRAMLRAIRRDERKRGALASYAFIVQEEDIKELIETVWHGHSILSQCDIRKELRLPRWDKGDDWSPWNCICLTEEETRFHLKISYLNEVYSEYFINDIQSKHMLSRLLFRKLEDVNFDFVESLEWWNVGLDGKTV